MAQLTDIICVDTVLWVRWLLFSASIIMLKARITGADELLAVQIDWNSIICSPASARYTRTAHALRRYIRSVFKKQTRDGKMTATSDYI